MTVTQRGEARRRDILRHTIETIADRGIENTRFQDVAASADVSIGTVQHYFGSRDDLIDAALSAHTLATISEIWSTIPEAGDPWQGLVSLLHGYRVSGDIRQRARIWISLSNSAMNNPRHRTLLESLYFEWGRPFMAVIQRGTEQGVFHLLMPVETCVDILLRLTDGYAMAEATSLTGGPALSSTLAAQAVPGVDDRTEAVFVGLAAALVGRRAA
ncbi:TetR/AcrR family transcriptional regulator [Pseudoclavibacter sp. 13-3]|uniref:TetR/AcrR family transcriptional regulator n=1 Tax=Pseudoclavibacter sp. 13-3 TaxID=2901228 RepID=UPI001E28FD54|nr:TetR/AcrR family transcriptional regulator [Pseudoclavibacter sp. 13-3]MCD7101290.1 TetR/AcrR family transcriptional regulator [Pseudoclavibacter sp. 13-3]